MSRSRRPRPALPLAALVALVALAALAALAASGCVGPFRRAFAPEQRVTDLAATRDCTLQMVNELGYVTTDDREGAVADSVGASRFVAERRGATADGTTVIDQLAVSLRGPSGADERGTLRVVPARFEEDSQRALSPTHRVPRMRPPGPAEGAGRLEADGVRRRRVDAGPARRDAVELTSRCVR